jgi:hypothetical protein
MTRLAITRFNIETADESVQARFGSDRLLGLADGPFERETRYVALSLAGRYWTYERNPEFTIILEASEHRELPDSLLGQLGGAAEPTASDQSICTRVQIFGKDDPLAYSRVLMAQMNVTPSRLEEFHDWYNNEHIPQAGAIPGFGTDHRRFELESALAGEPAHTPRFLAMYEIRDDADVMAAINSDEYRAWSGDFLARWRDGTSDEVSTICERVA